MKIAILNESFFTDQHLNQLRSLGEVVIYDNTDTEEKAISRLQDAEVAIVDCYIAPLTKTVLESTETLKLLAINSTGYDLVDITAAKDNGIKVASVPGFATEAVAEHAFALMLSVSKKIALGDKAMRKSPFQIDPANQEHKQYLGFNLAGKTLGIVGLGSIGQHTAQIGMGFGMTVIAYNKPEKSMESVQSVSLQELLKVSDIVSLHLPLSSETENFLTAEQLHLMKPSAILINTARGKLVDESALYKTLRKGQIAGAGLDTIASWESDNPLLGLDNVVFSPHSAFFTQESLNNAADIIVANVEAFIKGQAVNVVNS